MFRKNNSVKKMNKKGGYCYRLNQILKVFLVMLFFAINVFAEIPHSYVTENPDKEVTQTETLKRYKEKAELNLSVTKLNSEEIEGFIAPEQNKIYFSLDNTKYGIQPGDHIYVSEELQEVPSISTTNGRRKINGMLNQKVLKDGNLEYTVTNKNNTTEIEVSYSNDERELQTEKDNLIYIGILDSQYQVKNVLKGINTNTKAKNQVTLAITDEYNKGKIQLNHDIINNLYHAHGIEYVSGYYPQSYNVHDDEVYINDKLINNQRKFYIKANNMTIYVPEYRYIIFYEYKFPASFEIKTVSYDVFDNKIINYLYVTLVYKPSKLEGTSNLTLDTTYKPEYIPFTSCSIDNKQNIGLENPVTGVTLSQASGNGLITLEHNDILEVNGKRYTIGFDGNLPERHDTLGKIDYSLKTVNGNLQLKIDKYGLGIEQPQPLNLKVIRANAEVMTHTMNIKVPKLEKVVGESDLSVDEYYNKSEYITLSSCTLENSQDVSLVTPIKGVALKQYKGKGIVRFEPGDILEVNGIQTTINSSSGIDEKNENIGGVNIYYKVQNGNFQIRVDDYKIEQESPQNLILKLLRNGIEIMDHKINLYVPKLVINNSKMNVKIRDEYKEEYFNIYNLPYNVKGIEFLSGDNTISVTTPGNYKEKREYGGFWINGVQVVGKKGVSIPERTLNFDKYTVKTQRNGNLIISLSNYPKKISEPIELTLESYTRSFTPGHDYGGGNDGHNGTGSPGHWSGRTREQIIVFYYVPSKVVGQSTLEVKEYYPSPEYIKFNSCTTPAPAPIELENALRDVKVIQNSGNGLVNLEQGDILELNGKQYTITTGGTLTEQHDIIGNINFKFKVENGKIRLALKDWGVLEPDRLLTINASREGHPIMEHKMIIKAPRRVEGTSTLTFTEKYPIRDIVRFQGISLTAPTIGGIEAPVPNGVSYKSDDGYGIPFMKEGDILEVQCETMRAIKQYTIDSKNSLKHQTIDLPGTVLSLLVEDGKLRLGLNNWLVNKNTVLNFRVIRGVNEISNTSMTLEVPKAPFDILKNGILDFGKLIQGSKNKKAETSILLEMHQDISNVKYSLSTTTPELVNSSGATLQARDLQAGVQKQGNRRHLVRIIGRLDVPEKQELGVYRGSVLLNVTIK